MKLALNQVPKDSCTYEHQVAGHGYSQRCELNPSKTKPQVSEVSTQLNKSSVLHSPKERCVYKPVQGSPKGDREIQFYQDVFQDQSETAASRPEIVELRNLLPAFGGVHIDADSGRRYLRLDDLLADFVQPSVMDLKMGARSYEPGATERKRAVELAKYEHREAVGFLVTGLRAWRHDQQMYEHLGKRHWAQVTPDQLQSAVIPPFLSSVPRGAHRRRAVSQLLLQLHRMKAWFESQTLYHFYASSVLLAVESCPTALDDSSSGASSLNSSSSALQDARAASTVNHSSQPANPSPDTEEPLSNDESNGTRSLSSRSSAEPSLDAELYSTSHASSAPIALAAMIDFTHAVPGNGCHDDNYLIGLRTLIDLLRNYQKQMD